MMSVGKKNNFLFDIHISTKKKLTNKIKGYSKATKGIQLLFKGLAK